MDAQHPTPAAVIAEGQRLTQDYYANPTCNVRRFDAEHWLVMHGHALLAIAEAAVARLPYGHNDTCSAVLDIEPPHNVCSCGHDNLAAATASLAPTTKETDR